MIQSMTIRELLEWYATAAEPSTVHAAQKERERILGLFGAAFGDKPVTQLRGADLVAFVKSQPRVKAGWTVCRWYRVVKQAFSLAAALGMISHSPLKGVRLPRGKPGRDLTPTEFVVMLRHAPPAFRRVLLFLRYTGARPCEMRKATWDDLSWEDACITLKTHKTLRTMRNPRPRRLVLCSLVMRLLRWMKKNAGKRHFIFTNSYGGQWHTRALCKNIAAIREAAGLPHDAKLYSCRHLFATSLALRNVEVATISELLGHTSLQYTATYLHLETKPTHLRAAVERGVAKDELPLL